MINLTDNKGRDHFLAPSAIARVQEAGTNSQWHGVCAIVHTFDGHVLEVRERGQYRPPSRDAPRGVTGGQESSPLHTLQAVRGRR